MRIPALLGVYTLFFIFLLTGLFRLQLIQGSHFVRLGEKNRIRVIPSPAARGSIRDRAGHVLAETRPSFKVLADPGEATPASLTRLAGILSLDEEDIFKKIAEGARMPFLFVTVSRDISMTQVFQVEEQAPDLPGVFVEIEPIRHYPQGKVAAHTVGYVSLSGARALPMKAYGVSVPEPVGVTGLEKTANDILRGEAGGQQIEVNHLGHRQRLLGFKMPNKGGHLSLTLDLELERAIQSLLGARPAAVVAMNPQTGEVLALASSPSFDPAVFVEPGRSEERIRLLRDVRQPLFNRALTGAYPPGSTFKMITALAALEAGVSTPSKKYGCSGKFFLGNTSFACWNEGGHGMVDLTEAIAFSCNSYFYRLGLAVGVNRLARMARRLGLGRTSGIELSEESRGLVPDPSWKKSRLGMSWYKGETAHLAIGQGYLTVTPLQMARFMSLFANGGFLVYPHLIQGGGKAPEPVHVSTEHIRSIRRGLVRVCNDPRGTGRRAAVEGWTVAGKTGTAETGEGRMPHAWFCGFAPAQDPQLVVAVFVENGGQGSREAAAIAGHIFSWWKARRA